MRYTGSLSIDAGPDGARGATGDQGFAGDAGLVGPKSAAGVAGPVGDTGAPGPKGSIGAQGSTGDLGPAGPVGVAGDELTLPFAISITGNAPYLFSSDFPHEVNSETCKAAIGAVQNHGALIATDKAAILGNNAARFYGLD